MNIITEHDAPRVQDLNLAYHLGFVNTYKIRHLIERSRTELERFGEVLSMVDKTLPQGGRPGKSFYLNRKQCLYICAKSETPNAAEVTIMMVDLFDNWLDGREVKVREHWRTKKRQPVPPQPQLALPAPMTIGFNIEPVTNDLRRFTAIGTDRVVRALAARWANLEIAV
jgi:hypothetical protein